jgi:DNA primase
MKLMDAVEEVKSRLAIEDVVGEYVQLKRAGRNFKGLSPFTSEKSPSFVVSPEKQIWHDFSSGKGGSMFSFVMEMEGLDFRQALELLARKAGVDLAQFGRRTPGDGKFKERLYEALEAAARFYQVQFSQNQKALEYIFGKRKFTKEIALEFRLGYSPNNGSALMDYLKSKGFNEKEIAGAGLSAKAYHGGLQDMFRGRIMVPLADAQGRIIGFTARLLDDQPNAPKYINTPQTPLYDKSRHVYGLHLAKEAIRKTKYVVLVEGNLDVIASHQVGVRQAVATAGTALTEPHLKTLSRFTGDIRLSFDADKAGIAATERAIPIASKVGVQLSIITIPSGKDPDELIQAGGVETWERIINEQKYALDWLMERYEKLLDVTSAQGKKQYSDVLLPIVRALRDSVEQDHYMLKITEVLGVSRAALNTKLSQSGEAATKTVRKRTTPVNPEQIDRARLDFIRLQDHFLSLLLLHPKLRPHAKFVTEDMLATDEARDLFKFLRDHEDFNGQPEQVKELMARGLHSSALQGAREQRTESYSGTAKEQHSEQRSQRAENDRGDTSSAGESAGVVQSLGEYVKILSLQYEELYQGVETLELDYEVTRLQARLIEQYIKHEKQTLVTQLEDSSDDKTLEILTRVKELDNLLKQAQGRA